MISISVKSNMAALTRDLDRIAREQIPFATARALTQTAKDAAADITTELPRVFDRPTPFTLRGVGFLPANKINLTAAVFIKDVQAEYLGIQISGGTRFPKGKALFIPVDVPLNAYGNIPRNKIKQLLARKDTFSGTLHGIGGIWQRTRAGGVRLMIAWKPTAKYKPRFPMYGLVQRTVDRRFNTNFEASMTRALATANA